MTLNCLAGNFIWILNIFQKLKERKKNILCQNSFSPPFIKILKQKYVKPQVPPFYNIQYNRWEKSSVYNGGKKMQCLIFVKLYNLNISYYIMDMAQGIYIFKKKINIQHRR